MVHVFFFFFHFHMILSQFIFVTCSASICIVICNILNTADLCSNVIFLNALKAFFTYSVCISIFICDLSKRNYFDNFFLTVYFHIGHVVYLFNYYFFAYYARVVQASRHNILSSSL